VSGWAQWDAEERERNDEWLRYCETQYEIYEASHENKKKQIQLIKKELNDLYIFLGE
jgi:hypothetical protein